MPRVLVLGSANVDFTLMVERLPNPGETVTGAELFTSCGGKGANQAVAAARAGAEVRLLAKVGRDANGERLLSRLTAAGVACEGVLYDAEHATGAAFIVVDRRGQNQIAVASGANHRLSVADLSALEPWFRDQDVLLCQLEIPLETVACGMRLAKTLGMRTILNPAPASPLPPELWKHIDLLVPNRGEAERLLGTPLPDVGGREALGALRRHPGQEAVVTRGERGALWIHAGGVTAIPPFPVTSRDSTGAGDAFCGTLAALLAEGRPMAEALRYAAAAGALATTVAGAMDSLPSREQIEKLLNHSS